MTQTTEPVAVRRLSTWSEIMEAADFLAGGSYVVRGHDRAEWPLRTSIEREFVGEAVKVEQKLFWQFVRLAPRLLPGHLVPDQNDVAAWLGLIQHYGGPTRLLDVSRSPYVGLYFSFEASGDHDRALWAIDQHWCTASCARAMAREPVDPETILGRLTGAQAQLVYSLFYKARFPDPLFQTFEPFTGVFPLDPWKPDSRQSAQQAMFLCTANAALGFMDNVAAHGPTPYQVIHKFILPAGLRAEVIDRLQVMNVTAATLFPDLGGLARSLRTLTIRRDRTNEVAPPWATHS